MDISPDLFVEVGIPGGHGHALLGVIEDPAGLLHEFARVVDGLLE